VQVNAGRGRKIFELFFEIHLLKSYEINVESPNEIDLR
jgi:hypothetical protein